MAENVTLGSFNTLQNSSIIATLNANNAIITNAFADCLSLSGGSPNKMLANLDLNNFQVLNLPAPGTLYSPIRLVDLENAVIGSFGVGIYGLLAGNNTWTGDNVYTGNLTTFIGNSNINQVSNVTFAPAFQLINYTNDATGGQIGFLKQRGGSWNVPGNIGVGASNVLNGDEIGTVAFGGWANNANQNAAGIFCFVDNNVSGNNVPTRLTFSTSSTSAQLTNNMIFDSSGNWSVPGFALVGTSLPNLFTVGKLNVNAGMTGTVEVIGSAAKNTSIGTYYNGMTFFYQLTDATGVGGLNTVGCTSGFDFRCNNSGNNSFAGIIAQLSAISNTGPTCSGSLNFLTANAATAASLAMIINASGGVYIGNTQVDPGAHNLQIQGSLIGTTATFATGASNNIAIGTVSNYNVLSLNNSLSLTTSIGLFGGASGDPSMVVAAPSGGQVVLRIAGSNAYTANAATFTATPSTASTSKTTGAIVSTGGLGVSGTIWGGSGQALAAPSTQAGTSFSTDLVHYCYICTSGSAVTVTLPAASSNTGYMYLFKETGAGAVSSASSNVVPLAGGAAGTTITTAAAKWALLQSDGTNWVIIASN